MEIFNRKGKTVYAIRRSLRENWRRSRLRGVCGAKLAFMSSGCDDKREISSRGAFSGDDFNHKAVFELFDFRFETALP